MKKKFQINYGKTHYPDQRISVQGTRIKGPYWNASWEGEQYFLEFEAARQGGGTIKIPIDHEVYESLKQDGTDVTEIIRTFDMKRTR